MRQDGAPVAMRFVSLFAGVGGFDLGLERAGHECIAQVEIDKHCRTVLDKHWPDVPKHDDVRTAIEFADTIGLVGRTDLVCGGFPCQDVSVAGKRAGLAGERTGLFWDALAFTTHVEARWLLLENVPGLLTSNQGRDFGTILLALDDAGFCHLEWRVLDSQFFGVPQRRRRVFLVASTSVPDRRPLLAEWEGCGWDPATYREARQAATCDVEGGSAAGFYSTAGSHGVNLLPEQSPTVKVGSGLGIPSPPAVIAFNWQNGGGYGNANPGLGITEEGTGPLSTSQVPAVAAWWDGGGIAPTIDSSLASKGQMMPDKGRMFAVVAPTLSASNNPSRSPQSAEVTAQVKATHDAVGVVRRLTPIECERLQGFPDDWTAGLADSHRYKQMGNAVTVNVAHYIGTLLPDA